MKLTLSLAEIDVTINLSDLPESILGSVNSFYGEFTVPTKKADAEVKIAFIDIPEHDFPFKEADPIFVLERLLPTQEVKTWFMRFPECADHFPINEMTICTSSLNGLLLFNQDTAAGRIYLLENDKHNFHSIYRLLWVYLAQVLGERGGCFLHAAALVKEKAGYLFLGDSGAGKSTVAGLLKKCCVFSDDGPIFFPKNGEYLVYPSPFHQMWYKRALDKNLIQMRAKVLGLYFLIQDKKVYLEDILIREAFSRIIKQHIHFFSHLSVRAKTVLFDIFFRACDELPAYRLHFARDQDIWSAIKNK
jgi:hypothetical protein